MIPSNKAYDPLPKVFEIRKEGICPICLDHFDGMLGHYKCKSGHYSESSGNYHTNIYIERDGSCQTFNFDDGCASPEIQLEEAVIAFRKELGIADIAVHAAVSASKKYYEELMKQYDSNQ